MYKSSPAFIDSDGTRIYHSKNQVVRLKRIGRAWHMFERGPDGSLGVQPQRFSNLDIAERWLFENLI